MTTGLRLYAGAVARIEVDRVAWRAQYVGQGAAVYQRLARVSDEISGVYVGADTAWIELHVPLEWTAQDLTKLRDDVQRAALGDLDPCAT